MIATACNKLKAPTFHAIVEGFADHSVTPSGAAKLPGDLGKKIKLFLTDS